MYEDRKGRPPWAEMPDRDVNDNIVRGGGIDGEWLRRRNWGLAILAVGAGSVGILAYYIKKYGSESEIYPHDDELCGDLFDDLDIGTQGGNCPGSINGKSEPVFSGQVSNNIDPEEMVAVPEGVLVAGAGLTITVAALAFTLWLVSRSSPRSAPAY